MMQAGMDGARIYQLCKRHLVNTAQALVIAVGYNLEYERIINCNKTIYGVIDDLSDRFRHSLPAILLKLLLKAADKSTKANGIN